MNGGRPVFPFDLRAVRFEEDGQEWVVFNDATDGERAFPPARSGASSLEQMTTRASIGAWNCDSSPVTKARIWSDV